MSNFNRRRFMGTTLAGVLLAVGYLPSLLGNQLPAQWLHIYLH